MFIDLQLIVDKDIELYFEDHQAGEDCTVVFKGGKFYLQEYDESENDFKLTETTFEEFVNRVSNVAKHWN